MSDTVQITIPTIGTRLRLTRGWAFTLYPEHRNETFGLRTGIATKSGTWAYHWVGEEPQLTLPKGTILVVDRIYIRKGKECYDSITFCIKKGEHPDKKVYGRFWAKLGDVNRIRCVFEEETVKRDTKVDAITQLGGLGA